MAEWRGTREITGFTKLGDVAPAIKMKKLTGTTGATEGSGTDITHGLDVSKIIGLEVLVANDSGSLMPPGWTQNAEHEYYAYLDPSFVGIRLTATNSGNMLSNAITVLLTYEE